MKRLTLGEAAQGAVTLGMFSASAPKRPRSATLRWTDDETTGENSLTQEVRYGRRCWRHRGHLHCRRGA